MRLVKPKENCRLFAVYSNVGSFIVTSEGRTIRKLMRGRAKYQKKYWREGKLNEKKTSCTPINPKKYSCYGLKKCIQGI